MSTQLRVLIPVLVVLVIASMLSAAPARANYPYTIGGESIRNARPTGDTLPFEAGQMSVRWNNSAGGDTRYADTAEISTEVDTGYDILNIGAYGGLGFNSDSWSVIPATSIAGGSTDTGEVTITPGDTIVHAFQIHNRSNNPAPIPFRLTHLNFEDLTNTHDTFSLELFYADGAQNATDLDSGTMTRINGNDTDALNFAYDTVKTVFAVISPKSHAGQGDSMTSQFTVSNQAPPSRGDNTLSGDQWQEGRPIARADENDTQVYWMTTIVEGPVLQIDKSLASLSAGYGNGGQFRPGDTIEFTITVNNVGADTAYGVNVVDAIPDSTTYVAGSATFSDAGGNEPDLAKFAGDGIGFSTTYSSDEDFAAAEPAAADVSRIMWALETVGDEGSLNSVVIKFQVTID